MWRKLGFLLLIFAAAGLVWMRYNPTNTREFVRFRLGEGEYTAVVARTPGEVSLGLSGRTDIGADAMLFLLPQGGRPSFWMYKMRFPLDFVWLANGQVVDRHQNIPTPASDVTEDIPSIRPSAAVDSVLELPAGFIAEHHIEIGTRFEVLPPFFRRVW